MSHASDIVGYSFNTENFCPDCIIEALPTGPGETFDGWKLADGVQMSTEDNLHEIAAAFQIDRQDERSFDSSEFPKVIFSSQVEDSEECALCGVELDNPDSFPTNPLVEDFYHYGNERSRTMIRLRDLRAKLEAEAEHATDEPTRQGRRDNVRACLTELEVTGHSASFGWHTYTMQGR